MPFVQKRVIRGDLALLWPLAAYYASLRRHDFIDNLGKASIRQAAFFEPPSSPSTLKSLSRDSSENSFAQENCTSRHEFIGGLGVLGCLFPPYVNW
jgi:hypothetical protein